MKPISLTTITLLIATPTFAQEVKHYPPTSYTITLTPDQLNLLGSIFPAAEMPQNHWKPLFDVITAQVQKQNTDAMAADKAASDATKKK